ncbi:MULTISPECIES: hypothetical protein [unclassified Variovorax]|uniref:hypothetical protein n=1 Tax=unclassified Variovorax TaxID=663243 RepID=UPI00257783AB|nr:MULTISPECIES: hypothetical protein [unclassified Variovorax]MDM0090301.1 hypothetical protein [Variovorax sp. J22G40]MDM0148033.1 hypothetical protein [Variovorax sp. J2P1-31]
MIKMTSARPLLVNGEAGTEFETDEQHARELELKGFAVRVQGEGGAAAPRSAESGTSTDTAAASAPARTSRRASNKAS